jgi:heme transport system ATP-binding protein
MNAVLEASNVSFRIGGKALLTDVSLSIGAGEAVALVGPNGAGKSTLLRILAGEMPCSEGKIRLKGSAPRSYGARALALHRAVLSQSTIVTFPFSVREIVQMGGGEVRGASINALVDRALAEVDLEGFQDRIIGTLSGGEQQRAHFARVMVQLTCGTAAQGPGMLLLDEPTASLDLRHQLDLVTAIGRRRDEGVAVIAVLHDLNLAARLAKRIVVLDQGRIVADDTPANTITDEIACGVFEVADAVSRMPPPGMPFVLPHLARKRSAPE